VLVFSDANAILNRDSLLLLLQHFADPDVAAVAGEKKIEQTDWGANKEGMYWQYESWLKKLDAENGSVMGAAGELFAIRRELYEPLPPNIILDDFVQSLQVVIRGYRLAYEPLAFAQERPSASVKEEMKRKIRIAAGAFQAMIRLKPLFNIFRYPGDAFRFISHRVLRWTVCPPALLLLLLSNICIFISGDSLFYALCLLLQLMFYLAAFLAMIFQKLRWKAGILGLPYYFLQMNISVCIGFIRFMTGGQSVLWEKADRA
jgi:cellulose synthase/poly-beta-1,6-N-acetylglucosamine synthase-like glycosyltransferase